MIPFLWKTRGKSKSTVQTLHVEKAQMQFYILINKLLCINQKHCIAKKRVVC